MGKLSDKLKEEFIALLPPAIFFFVALHLVAFVRALMLEGTGISVATSVSVTLAALIIAKAVLYNIAWKTVIYMLAASLIHYAERLYEFSRKAGGIVAGNEKLLAEMVWPHFWAIQIFLLVVILMYCTMRELIRVIGRDKVRDIFFGPPRGASTPP